MIKKAAVTSDLPAPKGQETFKEQPSARYSSSELFKGQNEIQIEHQGSEYRLRITRSGGLILNK